MLALKTDLARRRTDMGVGGGSLVAEVGVEFANIPKMETNHTMIYLHKVLPALASPIVVLLLLVVASMLTKSRWIKFLTIFIFLVASNPIIAKRASAYLEKDFPPTALDDVRAIDTVIVLSGMVNAVRTSDGSVFYEFGSAVDRIDAGIALLQTGTADHLILTRGQVPWSIGIPEGEHLMNIAMSRGVAEERITLTDRVENTEQEARAIASMIAPGTTVGLVTSAFHMPRALQVFQSQGIDVLPIAVDYRQSFNRTTLMDFIPSANALSNVSSFTREMIGRAYYNLKF